MEQESFARNVLWSLKEYPEIQHADLPDADRLAKSLLPVSATTLQAYKGHEGVY